MKEVGVEHFMEERTLLRTRRSVMMDPSLPFADMYNEKMSLLVAIEQRKMECRHQIRSMRAKATTVEMDEKIERKKIRQEMIQEEWMVVDDTLTLLQECSDAALAGNVAGAWQVWDDAQEEQKGCSKSKAFKTRMTAANVTLKEKAKTDQATYVAMQLGANSAMLGGQNGNSFRQAGTRGGRGYQAHQNGGQPYHGQAYQAQGQWGQQPPMPRPMPPGPPPIPPAYPPAYPPVGGKMGGKGGKGGYLNPIRIRFEAAEVVFGAKCPAQLRGVMVPAPRQMRFRFGKTLQDPPKQPLPGMGPSLCRVCWKMPPHCAVSHEAFSCEENFDVGGVPAKGYRQLHRMGLLDASGDVI